MIFIIGHKKYELLLVDDPYGYDIYEDKNHDPINLGDIAYFDNEPTQKDVETFLADFGEIT